MAGGQWSHSQPAFGVYVMLLVLIVNNVNNFFSSNLHFLDPWPAVCGQMLGEGGTILELSWLSLSDFHACIASKLLKIHSVCMFTYFHIFITYFSMTMLNIVFPT